MTWLAICVDCWKATPAPRVGIDGRTLCNDCFRVDEQKEREWGRTELQSTVYDNDVEFLMRNEE